MTIMPYLDENSIQSVEFEAPLSADASSAPPRKHFSIDLSLELERQLDMESYPPTPSHDAHTQQNNDHAITRESLDSQILAHIIKQLRQSLLDATKDRDELLEMVALSTTHETELQEALQHMTDKATTMEVELSDARKQIKDDEDSINMLRTKVEESRRGLMRLQTESRRQSLAPASLDISRAGIPLGSPPSAKRATFAPLTGRPSSHRRTSDVSDFGAVDLSISPNFQSPAPEGSFRRHSGLYGRTSPSLVERGHSDALSTELDGLRREVRTLKDELEHVKHELSECNEAREASEMCVKALREFIEENDTGAQTNDGFDSIKLPTPPTMTMAREEDESKKAGSGVAGWGLKLWKDATLRTPSLPQSATFPPPATDSVPQGPASATPLSRKLGGFFSSRVSVSSIGSNPSHIDTPPPPPPPPLQTNAAMSVRDSMYSFSDASSVAEPASPPPEVNMHHLVVVRDVTSDVGSLGTSPSHVVEAKEVRTDDAGLGRPVVVS